MSICCATLMCHAPIVIPDIGGERGAECEATTQAMREAARDLVAHQPDVVVLVSPHAPRARQGWAVAHGERLDGHFGRFGMEQVRCSAAGAPEAAEHLERALAARGLTTAALEHGPGVDHGSTVPLWFLAEQGWSGPTLIVALPLPGQGGEDAAGGAIADAAAAASQRWAVLASGDMSHRLTPDAPAGFDERAQGFDDFVRAHVAEGDYARAVRPDPELRERAAQDVVESLRVAAAACDYKNHRHHSYGYEGPFGVGYLEALLYSDGTHDVPRDAMLDLVRDSIRANLEGRPIPSPNWDTPWDTPKAVFVTLRAPDGELRGCIGRMEPLRGSLAEEIADCAVSSASRDPRMVPVGADEVDSLRIEVSVLEAPEPTPSRDALDPHRYGIVVSHGSKRGVLLPNVPGVDTVEQQVSIAAQKGQVDLSGPHEIERFEVLKIG